MTHNTRGLPICRRYFQQVMAPVLHHHFPALPFDAALIGTGSEVLGFDDATSTDHDFFARAFIFVHPNDASSIPAITQKLAAAAPPTFEGLATAPERQDDARSTSVNTLGKFLKRHLGFDPRGGLSAIDWLTIPSQSLLELTSGAVFHSGLNVLQPLREQLQFYPHDIWLYAMACQWQRIAQEEHLMGRTVMVNDTLGARIIAARLVRDAMQLAFLMERRYAPYPKWFGTAFAQLSCASRLKPMLDNLLTANLHDLTNLWSRVGEQLATMHNNLGITSSVEARASPFHTRPFTVIDGERFVAALQAHIEDSKLRNTFPIGTLDQWTDSTELRERSALQHAARALYMPQT